MHPEIESKLPAVRELCRKHQVKRLWLFGSAATDDFDPARSDVDALVEFEAMDCVPYKRSYFALWEDLEQLFAGQVDVVTEAAARNRYFRQEVERTWTPVVDG